MPLIDIRMKNPYWDTIMFSDAVQQLKNMDKRRTLLGQIDLFLTTKISKKMDLKALYTSLAKKD